VRKRICISVVVLVLITVVAVFLLHQRNVQLARIVQAAALAAPANGGTVTLPEFPNPKPSPEFLAFFANALKRATITYDPQQTRRSIRSMVAKKKV
jgi:hypothetical protein